MYSDNQSRNAQHRNSILFACKRTRVRRTSLRDVPRDEARDAAQIEEHMHKRANVHKPNSFSYRWESFFIWRSLIIFGQEIATIDMSRLCNYTYTTILHFAILIISVNKKYIYKKLILLKSWLSYIQLTKDAAFLNIWLIISLFTIMYTLANHICIYL